MFHKEDFSFDAVNMSFPGPADISGSRGDDYHVSPTMMPAQGFLTPPYNNLDIRRDSVASSQSSMSFTSSMSEYSGPVTPTGPNSPSSEEYMGYDFNDLQSQPMHCLPMGQPSKVPTTPEQHLFSPWHLVPHSAETTEVLSTPFHPQMVLPPTEGDFLPQNGIDMSMSSDVESHWGSITANFRPDLDRQWENRTLEQQVVPESLWPTQMHGANSSVSMTDIHRDYAQIEPACFQGSDVFDNSSFPRSPQEVSFKRESSPELLKHESDGEEGAARPTRSMHVNQRGGKTVKKEQRRSDVLSRRQSRISKKRERSVSFDGAKIGFKLDGVQCIGYDEVLKRYQFQPTREPGPIREACDHPGCTKSFQRPEHLKRHKETHTGERKFPCRVCNRVFNRNDNCREHMWTHVAQPGKKAGRNSKLTLAEVEAFCSDDAVDGPKLVEKLRQKMKKAMEEAGISDIGLVYQE